MMYEMDDIENNSNNRSYGYNLIDMTSKLNNYSIKRKRSLILILALSFIQFVFYIISNINFLKEVNNYENKNMIINFTIIDIIFNILNILLIIISLISHKNMNKSQNYIISSYIIQTIYRMCVIFYFMLIEFIKTDYKKIPINSLISYGSITLFIIQNGGLLVIQFFFLILGLINSSNDYYKIFNNYIILKFRNLLSCLFISIITILFSIVLYFIINICYIFNYENAFCPEDIKFWSIFLFSMPYVGFVLKILIDNYLTSKNKKSNWVYSLFFFIIRFIPILVICNLIKINPNYLQIIISNYYSNLVITDYLVKNYN